MFLRRDQVREIDRRAIEEFGVPGIVLMENAGRGAAEVLRGLGVRGPVAICCGGGNNGGDGLVIARHLDLHRIPVHVFLFADPAKLPGDAATNFRIVTQSGIPVSLLAGRSLDETRLRKELCTAGWIVDALFGTGLTGPVRAPFDRLIPLLNELSAPVLAVDIPSGLDCDTGAAQGPTVRARHTVTFIAPKKGFAMPAAQEWLGQVHVVDIGAPRKLIEEYGRGELNA